MTADDFSTTNPRIADAQIGKCFRSRHAVPERVETQTPDATHGTVEGERNGPRSSHLAGHRQPNRPQAVERCGEGPRHPAVFAPPDRLVPASTKRPLQRWTFPAPLADLTPRAAGARSHVTAPRHVEALPPSTSRERSVKLRHGVRANPRLVEANVPADLITPQLRRTRPRRSARFAKRPRKQAHQTHALLSDERCGLLTDKQIRRARPSLHQGVGAHHPRLHRHDKPEPQTLQMDQIRR